MSILPKSSYRFSGIPINISIALFFRSRKEPLKFIWNHKRPQITKKFSKWTRHHISWFQTKQRHGFDPWVRKIHWRRKGQPTPVFVPGKSHGQRSLTGYNPWGHKESDMTEHVHACTHAKSDMTKHVHTHRHTISCQAAPNRKFSRIQLREHVRLRSTHVLKSGC